MGEDSTNTLCSEIAQLSLTEQPEELDDNVPYTVIPPCLDELIEAVKENNVEKALSLIDKTRDLEVTDVEHGGWTPIMWAAHLGQCEVVRKLLKFGSDLTVRAPSMACKAGSGKPMHWTPLLLASRLGYADIAGYMLDFGADVNAATEKGWTPLIFASYFNHYKTVQVLLAHGANIDLEDKLEYTALHLAAQQGSTESIDLLLSEDSKKDVPNINVTAGEEGFTPLMLAAMNKHRDSLAVILRHNALVNYAKHDGVTALHISSNKDDILCVKELCKGGLIDLNIEDSAGLTPLQLSIREGCTNVTEYLQEMGVV